MPDSSTFKGLKAQVPVFLQRASVALLVRSQAFVGSLQSRMDMILSAWVIVFMAAAVLRLSLALTPILTFRDFAELFLPYALVALAPIAGFRLTLAAFPTNRLTAQPSLRFARFGRWTRIDPLAARRHPDFGPFGFMASLLLGLLINIPVRSFEFLVAIPAMNHHAPAWGSTIFAVMAMDVVAMNFLYMACFVMALRSNPYFPRLLGVAWILDIFLQFSVARAVVGTGNLPDKVSSALEDLLQGNITKVLISAAVWLPYLLLSARVNVTYRQRLPSN